MSKDWQNPDDETLRELLRSSRTIAVVGCSPNPERPSHHIAEYLIHAGYRVIPVHPKAREILGQKVYARLEDIDEPVDIVNVFRRSEDTPTIAMDAGKTGAKALWLQQGITHPDSARIAEEANMLCIMDACIAVMHRLLIGK